MATETKQTWRWWVRHEATDSQLDEHRRAYDKLTIEHGTLKAEAKRLRDMLAVVVDWINAECARGPDQEPIGYVVPDCRGIVERIGDVLDGKPDPATLANEEGKDDD